MSDRLITSRLPVVAAPMAGGPSTVALAEAVATAGGFPFLAGGYAAPDDLLAQIERLRAAGVPFGVNLFVPSTEPVDDAAFAAYAAELGDEAAAYDLTLDDVPLTDDDNWDAKLALLVAHPVPVVSFTFGLPDPAAIAALNAVGTRVLVSVTSPAEALLATDVGADGLVVQGAAAGGHSATFDDTRDPEPLDTATLVRRVRAVTPLPVVAAGGVDGPEAVRRLLDAGAEAVAVGTLLLRTDEAGTSPTHRRALGDPAHTETVVTRAFTGRPARALRNGFVDRHQATGLTAYPAVHHLTRALRKAAGAAGDADRLHLWAGTGFRSAPTGPAADVVRALARDI
ncbi:nitronate monooxygenase [Pseudoclavibacter chungangensis]|uniref:Propionate 3-nitronate monooxygenase n=1 Tax=Pseudoclavibacter chungangensis TaxID=587635 RepID=A0A7J5BSV8_9MICO|nr:nitronate monooxygenase [Pseudoclavibacter chungangensis]KAB1656353.1 nitronate monooxygenase [Pseudoclavibacter chungangensis]NYJ67125.1 NAD(P)H-dependent flavin oxidoreductase YrpB (nitropropane dioxygenase family) [Pseudoclavibacter chungangensis]